MKQLDNQLTQQLRDWLETAPELRDIRAGAELMLRLNRNRALYNSVLAKPDKYTPKLEYELRKYLRMRLDGMTSDRVAAMEAEVMPAVEKIVKEAAVTTSAELPEAKTARGKRADHDSLPDGVKALWDRNSERMRKIVLLFNELKAMSDSQPCDRYERLKLMVEAEAAYRADMARYDAWRPGMPEQAPEPEQAAVVTPDNARKSVSRQLKAMAASKPGEPAYEAALERLRAYVDIVISDGGTFSAKTVAALKEAGIRI